MNEFEGKQFCDLCASFASATWRGEVGSITVCPECAWNILPAIMADAIVPGFDVLADRRIDQVEYFAMHWENAGALFWKAAALKAEAFAKAKEDIAN